MDKGLIMPKLPDQIVADIDRRQNEEDLDLPNRAGRMLKEKLNEDLTGGAYVGSRLNMPSNTRLGKLSASDTRLYNDTMAQNARDRMLEGYGATPKKSKMDSRYGMKKGGQVSSASKRADGCAVKGKTRGKYL
jgi:hypothetical protein